jgi:hypothetical protein
MVVAGIKRIVGSMAGVLAVTLLLGASPASATTVDECKVLIDVVQTTLDGVVIGGGNPDRTRSSLESKLAGAKIKLDQAKVADALKKLGQFRDKIVELRDAAKPKIDAGDAQSLIDAVDDAIACVEDLG